MEWQLEHPDGTKDECIAWLEGQFTKGLVDLSSDPPASQKRVNNEKGNPAKKLKR